VQNNDGGQDPKIDEIRNLDTASMQVRFCELDNTETCDGHLSMEYAYFAAEEGLLTSTDSSDPSHVDTSQGDALRFDGSDDRVDIRDAVEYSEDSVTVAAWVKQTGDASSQYQRVTDGELTMWVNQNDGNTCVRLTATEGGGSSQTCFDTGLEQGEWYHLAFTYDDASDETTLYVDGEEFGTSNYYSGTMSGSTSTLTVGNTDSGNRPWNGYIDDVSVYPVALSGEQVKSVMSTGGLG
jgi:hypothetical protein